MITHVPNASPDIQYMKCASQGSTKPLHHRSKTRLHELMKIAAMLLLFLLPAAEMRGSSALDGFNPNVNGTVYVIAGQANGKISKQMGGGNGIASLKSLGRIHESVIGPPTGIK